MANPSISNVTQIDKFIKAGVSKDTSYPIAGFKGLELRIRPNGKAEFRHRYTHPYTGKRPYMTLGSYPAFSLAQAKQAYNDNMALLAQSIDPLTHKEQENAKQAYALDNTFEAVTKDWLNEQTNNPEHVLSASTIKNWEYQIEPLLKEFGKQPIDTITTPQVLRLFREVQKKHIQKGNRVKSIASRIFAHAVINGLIEHNPVLQLTGARALKPTRNKHHPAITTPKEFAILLNEIDSLPSGKKFQKEILQLLALTFARIGDVCAMKWADIDLNAKTWIFEPQKGKNRADMVDSLIVPLAPQTIAILEQVHDITGGMEYVFYTGKRKNAPYADRQQINKALNDPSMNKAKIGKDYCGRGYLEVHSPHGFRASAKTMLMERLGYSHLITEIQSGRSMPDAYGNTYNRMEAIKERVKMMNEWANYLDDIKAGKVDNILFVDFNNAKQQAVNE